MLARVTDGVGNTDGKCRVVGEERKSFSKLVRRGEHAKSFAFQRNTRDGGEKRFDGNRVADARTNARVRRTAAACMRA